MGMVTCPHCHHELPDLFDRCPYCKKLLGPIPAYSILIGCSLVLCVMFIVFVIVPSVRGLFQ